MQDLEQTIRDRAYHLWLADGCRDGNADAHWLNAQREILAASLGNIARVKVADAQAMSSSEKKPTRKATTKGKRRASMQVTRRPPADAGHRVSAQPTASQRSRASALK